MKKSIFIIAALAVVVASCGGDAKKDTSKGFAPKERKSNLHDDERQQAIDQKRAELNATVNLETLMNQRGVKLSILMPKVEGQDITAEVSEKIGMKMLEMAAQNGISGLGTSPGFVMGTSIAQTGRVATGSAPQKMMVKYDLTFKVMNTLTNDVYATTTQEVTGVGSSFPEANINAVSNIKNTPQIQQMLQTANDRIIEWYNTNLPTIKNQVNAAVGNGDYA